MKGYYGERRKPRRWPEGKFISGTREVGAARGEKEGRKNQENKKCIRRRGWKIEKQEIPSGSSKIFHFVLAFSRCPSLPRECTSLLDYRRN